jgi:hypothetical protein
MAGQEVVARVRLENIEKALGEIRVRRFQKIVPEKAERVARFASKLEATQPIVQCVEVSGPRFVAELLLEAKSFAHLMAKSVDVATIYRFNCISKVAEPRQIFFEIRVSEI